VVSEVFCKLCFDPNQPGILADDLYTGILGNLMKTYENVDCFLRVKFPCNPTRYRFDSFNIFITQF